MQSREPRGHETQEQNQQEGLAAKQGATTVARLCQTPGADAGRGRGGARLGARRCKAGGAPLWSGLEFKHTVKTTNDVHLKAESTRTRDSKIRT